MNLTLLASAQSCTSSCWTAKQPTCQCTCGGVNHGTLRPSDPSPAPDPEQEPAIAFQLTAFLSEIPAKPRSPKPTKHRPRPARRSTPTKNLSQDNPTMNRHLVTVTKQMIHDGQKCHLRECALALALNSYTLQARPVFTNVFVALRRTRLNNHTFLDHSPGIQEWILNNDSEDTPPPNPTTIVVDMDQRLISLREETSG